MATIALSALGAYIGGPQGAQIGALLGQQVDARIFGDNKGREGPRLKDLSITTSSYGVAIPRHFGQMRTAGSIIWSTDLVEHSETSGGKGSPKTTNYSYSISFAVALSSRPIIDVGRIWADGNLLRGASGDLKAGGTMRLYKGHGDQPVDPLLASAIGPEAPAFRGSAYIVFEDLALEEFGNRIPSLNFELIADGNGLDLNRIVGPLVSKTTSTVPLPEVGGLSYEGGSLSATVATIDTLYPLAADSGGQELTLKSRKLGTGAVDTLPPPSPIAGADPNEEDRGAALLRESASRPVPAALRYYDVERDYQPGVQRKSGKAGTGDEATIEFPAALQPSDASLLISRAAERHSWTTDRVKWRLAELDPAHRPGEIVKLPDHPGNWLITAWEWREHGVELELERIRSTGHAVRTGDAGNPLLPPDTEPPGTRLRAFELPWDGRDSTSQSLAYVAVAGDAPGWSGASLHLDDADTLMPLGSSGRQEATTGTLLGPLPPSPAIRFEPHAVLEIELANEAMSLASSTLEQLANGSNQLLVGNELLQFAHAAQTDSRTWQLTGLLRGRGGTESAAMQGHAAGTLATLVSPALIPISIPAPGESIAAIGKGDEEAVLAPLENSGLTLRPLNPVHTSFTTMADGTTRLCWTRRSRGAWDWRDFVDVPLNEESETYHVGIGPVQSPRVYWQVSESSFDLPAGSVALHSGQPVWVSQVGTGTRSGPSLILTLP